MNIVIILLLVLILGLIFFVFSKLNNFFIKNNEQKKEVANMKKELGEMLVTLNKQLTQQISHKNMETSNLFKNTTDTLDKKISNQNIQQMNAFKNTLESLDKKILEQNNTTNHQVKEIVERVSKLDSFASQVAGLNVNITNLEQVLNDKKARGTFGEIRLLHILNAVFGENQKQIFEEQYSMKNGSRVDFILHAPHPLGDIAIDSKFPLENYQRIIDSKNDQELNTARKNFTQDLKKHINDIADKYIIEGETASQAIMFIPAEAIFTEINGYHPAIISYSYQRKVWITSPTTLMATLNLLLVVLKDAKKNNASEQIHTELLKLKVDFDRYSERWENLNKHLETVNKDIKEIQISSQKIKKKFEIIEEADFDYETLEETNE